MQNPVKKKTFYPALEGLRGIAIIAVIIYHTFPYGDSLFGWLGGSFIFCAIWLSYYRYFNEITGYLIENRFF